MDMKDRITLGEPVSQLIGYCRSARHLDPESRHKEWVEGLMKLAENLDNAWEKVLGNSPGD